MRGRSELLSRGRVKILFLSPLMFFFSLLLPSEDETFDLCLGLHTLLELKVRSSYDFLKIVHLLICFFPHGKKN